MSEEVGWRESEGERTHMYNNSPKKEHMAVLIVNQNPIQTSLMQSNSQND